MTVSVHDVPAEKWQEHLNAIPVEEDSIRSLSRGCRKRQKIIRTMDNIPMDNIAQAVSKNKLQRYIIMNKRTDCS